jgi:hypothetical protein
VIDDMERADGRTKLGTIRVNGTDAGIDHSPMLFHRVTRSGDDHMLRVEATMSDRERPYVRVEFPLNPGAILPTDLSGFAGVQLEIRGEAAARLMVNAYGNRTASDMWAAAVPVTLDGQTVRVPFASLKRRVEGSWSAQDARSLLLEVAGPARAGVWVEVDNLRLYK